MDDLGCADVRNDRSIQKSVTTKTRYDSKIDVDVNQKIRQEERNNRSVSRIFRSRNKEIVLGEKTLVMAIVNITPDSFSDGGKYLETEQIVTRVADLLTLGADIIDVGGESTRPGYEPVSADQEWDRLREPLFALRSTWPNLCLSVDTQKAWVAEQAVKAGVSIVNDIWGLSGDRDMARVVADSGAGLVMMFNRQPSWNSGEVNIAEMIKFFVRQIQRAGESGISCDHILVDPGLGFGYGVEDNWVVLRHLEEFQGLGAGLLLGPSRKRFLGSVSGKPPQERDGATAAVCALAAAKGVDVMRVHNVEQVADALRVSDAWYRHV